MDIDLADLPDNVETLQRMVRTLATERANLTEAQAEIERLRLIVQKLQRSQFGRRLPLNKTETAAGGPWNNCGPFNAKLAPDATLMGWHLNLIVSA